MLLLLAGLLAVLLEGMRLLHGTVLPAAQAAPVALPPGGCMKQGLLLLLLPLGQLLRPCERAECLLLPYCGGLAVLVPHEAPTQAASQLVLR